ncbi:xylose ABC transporter ATP-binding protein [Streptomyces spectabilis]|nr:putative multiple sugar transport system ATP-binding protein [Streptomyces spectabilis]MCI3900796.1 sugar ABC transporter ATP-binding protein [Streptomyces spectabilis]GGV12496.1 xylose ABC transporter ATP-binding protein [Streptomyces spectabilis]
MSRPVLEMRGITKAFAGVKALADVDLTVRAGEIHAVCGENGAGKSTLMKVLSGVHGHRGYDGEIRWDGERVAFKDVRDGERHGIVIIHQELALVPHLSIAENVFLGHERTRRGGRVDWDDTLRATDRLLRRVGLAERPQTPVDGLGVGKQQLVEIAKALAKDVRLLILDEPTAALNDQDSAKLLDLVLGLRAQGVAVIVISHKLNEIRRVADTVTILRDGRSVETLAVRRAPGAEPCLSEDRVIRGMVGRDLDRRFPDRTPYEGHRETAFEVRGWTVRHPVEHGRTVVDDVSLSVRRGEIVGLAGLMGAGRTELAMSVFGRSYGRYVTGTVAVGGREASTRTVSAAIAAGLAYVTEDRKRYGLNLIDTLHRNISLASLAGMRRGGLLGGFVDAHHERSVAEGYRASLNIKAPTVFERVGRLSGGNQQKVVLSKWIHTDPEVLILDEPTRGVDVGAKYEIHSVVDRLAARGKAVLLISSELPELLGMCDRIYTMAEGRVTGEVPRAEATQEVLMRRMTAHRSRCATRPGTEAEDPS